MADPPLTHQTGPDPDQGSPPGMPRWVKLFGIALLVLVLLIVVILLTGVGGPHGPARHTPSGSPATGPVYAGGILGPR